MWILHILIVRLGPNPTPGKSTSFENDSHFIRYAHRTRCGRVSLFIRITNFLFLFLFFMRYSIRADTARIGASSEVSSMLLFQLVDCCVLIVVSGVASNMWWPMSWLTWLTWILRSVWKYESMILRFRKMLNRWVKIFVCTHSRNHGYDFMITWFSNLNRQALSLETKSIDCDCAESFKDTLTWWDRRKPMAHHDNSFPIMISNTWMCLANSSCELLTWEDLAN